MLLAECEVCRQVRVALSTCRQQVLQHGAPTLKQLEHERRRSSWDVLASAPTCLQVIDGGHTACSAAEGEDYAIRPRADQKLRVSGWFPAATDVANAASLRDEMHCAVLCQEHATRNLSVPTAVVRDALVTEL